MKTQFSIRATQICVCGKNNLSHFNLCCPIMRTTWIKSTKRNSQLLADPIAGQDRPLEVGSAAGIKKCFFCRQTIQQLVFCFFFKFFYGRRPFPAIRSGHLKPKCCLDQPTTMVEVFFLILDGIKKGCQTNFLLSLFIYIYRHCAMRCQYLAVHAT